MLLNSLLAVCVVGPVGNGLLCIKVEGVKFVSSHLYLAEASLQFTAVVAIHHVKTVLILARK